MFETVQEMLEEMYGMGRLNDEEAGQFSRMFESAVLAKHPEMRL